MEKQILNIVVLDFYEMDKAKRASMEIGTEHIISSGETTIYHTTTYSNHIITRKESFFKDYSTARNGLKDGYFTVDFNEVAKINNIYDVADFL